MSLTLSGGVGIHGRSKTSSGTESRSKWMLKTPECCFCLWWPGLIVANRSNFSVVKHPVPGGQPSPGNIPKLPRLPMSSRMKHYKGNSSPLGGAVFKMKISGTGRSDSVLIYWRSRMDTTNAAGLADGTANTSRARLGQDEGDADFLNTRVGRVSTRDTWNKGEIPFHITGIAAPVRVPGGTFIHSPVVANRRYLAGRPRDTRDLLVI